MNHYTINQEGHDILIRDQNTGATLKIKFTETVLNEDLEQSPITELINTLAERIHDRVLNLHIKGESFINLSYRYALQLIGDVYLDNVKLNNPLIENSRLVDVDYLTSDEAEIRYTTIYNSSSPKDVRLAAVILKYCSVTAPLRKVESTPGCLMIQRSFEDIRNEG